MTREMKDFLRDECEWESHFDNTEEPETVGECDLCGDELHDYDDECLAVVDADGTDAHVYCQYCARQMRHVIDVIDAAGLWYVTGYADDVIDAANEEVYRRSTMEQRLKKKLRFCKLPVTVERRHARAF